MLFKAETRETQEGSTTSTAAQVEPGPATKAPWKTVSLVLGVFVLLLYAPVLKLLVTQWWQDPNYGHGFVVPLFAGWVVWQTREKWQRVVLKPSNFGLLVIISSILLLLLGSLGAELFISRTSLIFLLAGIVLYVAGWKMLRVLAFPLGFLILMIPWPVIVYNQITFPLQLLASRFAANALDWLRVPVLREGNLLYLPNYTLEVVAACSGIRSLMTLVALALAYGYLVEKRMWARIVLVPLMLPIAVISNGFRIVGTGILTYFYGPAAAEGFFHLFSGWLIFVTALLLMLACHWVLSKIGGSRRSANV